MTDMNTPMLPNQLELDTAATMFSLSFCDNHRSLIRISVTMNEDIDIMILQSALNTIIPRFHMTFDDLAICAFKVFTTENQVILEYFHAISDGYGGSVFLKSLIAEYIRIRYAVSISYSSEVFNIKEEPKKEEIQDGYSEIAGSAGKRIDMSIEYSVKGEKDKKLDITELTFNTDELLGCASEYGVTLTAFLSGVLTLALFDLQKQEKRTQKEIRLSIPIDLRRRFQRNSLRNFTLATTIYAGKLKEETPFSNMGVWSLPDNLTPYIQQCSMAFTPKPSTPYSCAVVSAKNKLILTLTRSIKEPLLESRIIQILEKILSNNITQLELIA